jgi:3-oxoacyl-[acyl-carrier protein] reductase
MTIKGKTAIVTGGTRGIGRAIVLDLGKKGINIAFNYLENREMARSLEDEVHKFGGKVLSFQVDASDFSKVKEMVEEVRKNLGSIDFLINNAGITRDKALYLMDQEDWNRVMEVNLKGVYHFTRAVITQMMRQMKGRVVNIASLAGLRGVAGQTNYAASKAGIIGFTKALAKEVSPFHITVNAIAPGYIQTEMFGSLPEAQQKNLIGQIPLSRLGRPEEVAHLVGFLLSEEAAYITGAVIPIDGGLSI